MFRDGRAVERQTEHSSIVIAGVDSSGLAFEEATEIRDISEEGIAFYLNRPLWINSYVTATVGSSRVFTSTHPTRAMVVRIEAHSSGKRLVAARFDE